MSATSRPGGDATIGTVVIVGASHAGFQAAASLRQLKFAGRILLLGDEPHLPYHRPPLSKDILAGTTEPDAIRLRPAAFFEKSAIEFRPGTTVAAIRRGAREIETASGERIGYDHLILATGARHRTLAVPGADLDGIVSLRTRDEAVRLKALMEQSSDIVIVGGGFIGLEFASVAIKLGGRVTVLEVAPRALGRAVSAPISLAMVAGHERRGVVVRTGVSATAFVGDGGRVTGVATSAGDVVPAALVLVGIGVVPNTELAHAAGLVTGNGVLVDEHLLTADPAISAIGDCAAYPSLFAGGVVRLESVQNATDHARTVANRLTGNPLPYAAVPWFWSDQGDLKLQIVGLTAGHDQAVTRGDPSGGSFSVFCFRGPALLGIESINRPADHMAGRKLLAGADTLTPEQAADAGFPL